MLLRREASLFSGVLLGLTPFLVGQEPHIEAIPSADAPASRQLIAWSRLQKPQPVPQPLPPPDSRPDPQPAQPPSPHARQQTRSQTFTGKIVRNGEKYVLKVSSNTTYQLDEQSSAEHYQDKEVKIVGTVEPGSNTIHVVRIELLS
ncbi:MAG TPA: DUF5818 domain-containing protein [Candidatus Sulfotelmatobacter sp.]|nr:DUF5818 domain-containing protein [Candidatus Sulfotelmatobacter sp.]